MTNETNNPVDEMMDTFAGKTISSDAEAPEESLDAATLFDEVMSDEVTDDSPKKAKKEKKQKAPKAVRPKKEKAEKIKPVKTREKKQKPEKIKADKTKPEKVKVEKAKKVRKEKPQKESGSGKKRKGISIRYRLIASFLVSIILIVFLGIVSYDKAASAITQSYEETTVAVLERTADYYTLMFNTIKEQALEISMDTDYFAYYRDSDTMSTIDEMMSYRDLSTEFTSSILANNLIANAYIFAAGERPFYTIGYYSVPEADAFAASVEAADIDAKKAVWRSSHPYIDTVKKNKYGISFGRQLLNINYAPCGYVIVDVSLHAMHSPLDGLNFGENSVVLFVSPDGGELYTLQGEAGATVIKEDSTDAPETAFVYGTEFYNRVMATYNVTEINNKGSEYIDLNGETYLFSYFVFNGFMLSALVPQDVIYMNLEPIKNITVFIVILSIVLSAAIALVMAGSITSVIKKLMVGLERFASGDLTVNMKIKRRDEFQVLAGSANHAMENIRDLVTETRGISTEVHSTADTVTAHAHTLLDTTREITNSITEIEDGLLQQAEDTQNCMNQMEVLSDKITQVSENSERISHVSNETQNTVASGIQVIHDLNDKATETELSAKEILNSIAELKTASNSIVNIVNAINEISEQTNLLSLNASIEAARAGDAGRGFAVVADEIRKLSEQSAASANQIRDYVFEITKKTEVAVSHAKKSQDVVAYQRDQINRTVEMFNTMTEQVSTLTENLNNIASGIDDIQKTKQGTMSAIESISAVSQETAAAAEEVTSNVNLQLQFLEDFNTQADELIQVSGKLSEAINKFTV